MNLNKNWRSKLNWHLDLEKGKENSHHWCSSQNLSRKNTLLWEAFHRATKSLIKCLMTKSSTWVTCIFSRKQTINNLWSKLTILAWLSGSLLLRMGLSFIQSKERRTGRNFSSSRINFIKVAIISMPKRFLISNQ
jgi:hypothetical protein